ncbi:MAG: DNA-binding protein AraC-type [Paenibacillaceae bacterium]|nr:DNA-binding protein AraC-type [Paenibacillaceae bacterium]
MKTHTFFARLFISFTLLVMASVSVVYIWSYREIMNNAYQTIGNRSLENLQTADSGIKQLKDIVYKDCLSLSAQSSVINMNRYKNNPDIYSPDELFNISLVLDDLMRMVQKDNKYHSIYFYMDDFPYIFTSNNNLVKLDSFTDTSWMEYYQAYKTEKTPISFINTRHLVETNNNLLSSDAYVTTYVYPLTPYTSNMDGAIVVNLKEEYISGMLNSTIGSRDGTVAIINSRGEVISGIDRNEVGSSLAGQDYIHKILNAADNSGYFFDSIHDNKMLISFYKSSLNDWVYVGQFSTDRLLQAQTLVNQRTLAATILIVLLGILAAFIISRKLYNPVENIIGAIRNQKWIDLKDNEDELALIYRALLAVSKNESHHVSPAAAKKKLQETCILKLLGSDLLDEESLGILGELFSRGNYVCVTIEIDEYNKLPAGFDNKQWGYIKSLLFELSEEIAGEQFICMGCTAKKGELLVVCNTDEADYAALKEKLKDCFGRVQKEIYKILDNKITIGIGGKYADLLGIRDSYEEASTAIKQKLKLGLGHIIFWSKDISVSTYYYPIETEGRIQNCLGLKKKDELELILQQLLVDLKSREQLSCENIRQIVTQLVGNTIIKFIIEHHISFDEVYGLNSNVYSEINNCETLDSLIPILLHKYMQLLDYTMLDEGRSKTVDKIIDYIRSNYKKDIGINDISSHAGLSYSHARRIFKAETGTNMVDYINTIRINEAKELLTNPELSVKNIALALGYNNDQSFERYFKKLVGATPREYRQKKMGYAQGSQER